MLLGVPDLPGKGWKQLAQRDSRSVRSPLPLGRKVRYVAAQRKFRQEEPPQGLHVELLVFDGAADAERRIQSFRTSYVRYPGVTTLVEREVEGIAVPGVDGPYLWERENVRGNHRGFARSIAGRVNNVALIVIGSADGEGWSWEQLATIAGLQASKIREHVGTEQRSGTDTAETQL